MYNWYFPSRAYAETEGFSNAGLAEFRGNPLKALAREVCQNSLDAADGSGKPVLVEFQRSFIPISDFPGMEEMKKIIRACLEFWGEDGDINTKKFLHQAMNSFKSGNFYVLRISDFNTTGVQGAKSKENITPWGSLVKGNSFSVKADEKNAAGSYGIGKSAPFVSSFYQTVFYRTYDLDGVRAVLGVARLMAHKSVSEIVRKGEDPIRRSVGYFGEDNNRKPAVRMEQLDNIYSRTEHGTDLFVPGFIFPDQEWVNTILLEVIDNFLFSIYSGKLAVKVENRRLDRDTLSNIISRLGNRAKSASIFYKVISEDNNHIIEETKNFHNLGTLRLRLLYGSDLNKKILVVRDSGMKVSRIPSLPRGISYSGFLEIKGDELNSFFRDMENPQHTSWEPKRHQNPKLARKYKEEVEDWVRSIINKKILEISGEEKFIDIGECFNYQEKDQEDERGEEKKERIIDSVKKIEVFQDNSGSNRKFKVKDEGGNRGNNGKLDVKGRIDDSGPMRGHRTRTGKRKGGSPTGRSGYEDSYGPDKLYSGTHEVYLSARVISLGGGWNRLVFTADKDIDSGKVEIVTKGENGKSLQIYVQEVKGKNVSAEDGHIVISNILGNMKNKVEFKISGKRNYAMGVRAYGN